MLRVLDILRQWQDVSRLLQVSRLVQQFLVTCSVAVSPTCKDRVYASMMGALAVDLLKEGKILSSCRISSW